MKRRIGIILAVLFIGCHTKKVESVEQKYLRWVGDIEQDIAIDRKDFKLCNGDEKVIQYFNTAQGFRYKGEKTKLFKTFQKNFIATHEESQNGLIRIRFIVNCKGETGRFRILESDFNYAKFHFKDNIKNQLLEITKKLDGWELLKIKNQVNDYYQYLIFKIEKGQLIEILP
jgi:hypothetical protein